MESEKQTKEQEQLQQENPDDEIFMSYDDFIEMCKKFKKAYDAADKIRVPVWSIYEMIKNSSSPLSDNLHNNPFRYSLQRIAVYYSEEEAFNKSELFKGQLIISKEKKAVSGVYYNDLNKVQPTLTNYLKSSEENDMIVRFFTNDGIPKWFPLTYVSAHNYISPTTVFYMCKYGDQTISKNELMINSDIEYHFEE
jgi:hypothetical protein